MTVARDPTPQASASSWTQVFSYDYPPTLAPPNWLEIRTLKHRRFALSATFFAAAYLSFKACAYPFTHPAIDDTIGFLLLGGGAMFGLAFTLGGLAMATHAKSKASPISFNQMDRIRAMSRTLPELARYLDQAAALRRPITRDELDSIETFAKRPDSRKLLALAHDQKLKALIAPQARPDIQAKAPALASAAILETLNSNKTESSLARAELHNGMARAHLDSLPSNLD